MNFRATSWSYKIENGVAKLGFLGGNLSQRVLIRTDTNPREKDASIEKKSIYIEIGNPVFGVYDAIEQIEIKGNTINIKLKSWAVDRIRITGARITVKDGIDQIVEILRKEMRIENVKYV